jgi:hypothetical protein
MNAKMFGFNFFFDNKLSIKHLPPKSPYPEWMQLRQDIKRFIYEREKIRQQKKMKGMTMVGPEDFDPYPGEFLKDNLEEKIKRTCELMSEEYLSRGDREAGQEALDNINFARDASRAKMSPFDDLLKFQKSWQNLLAYTTESGLCQKIKKIIQRFD